MTRVVDSSINLDNGSEYMCSVAPSHLSHYCNLRIQSTMASSPKSTSLIKHISPSTTSAEHRSRLLVDWCGSQEAAAQLWSHMHAPSKYIQLYSTVGGWIVERTIFLEIFDLFESPRQSAIASPYNLAAT